MKRNTFSVAILLNGKRIQEGHVRALKQMIEETNSEIGLILANDQYSPPSFIEKIKSLLSRGTVWKLYSSFSHPSYQQKEYHVDDVNFLNNAELIRCKPIPANGIGNKLPKFAVEKLADYEVAIRFGFGILKGEALTAPKHGVLSFHGGNLSEYRGRPAGFWEFLNEEKTVGVTLQRIRETLDAGQIISFKKINISGLKSWPEVREQISLAFESMLASGVKNIQNPKFSPRDVNDLGKLYTLPTIIDFTRYFFKRVLIELRSRI